MRLFTVVGVLVVGCTFGFSVDSRASLSRRRGASASPETRLLFDYTEWCELRGVECEKVAFDDGVVAAVDLQAMDVVARIPKDACLSTDGGGDWAMRLAKASLLAREGELGDWVERWSRGGFATDSSELNPRDAEAVQAPLLVVGSDNDHEIYRKFGLKCHPIIDRAASRLARLSDVSVDEAREGLMQRSIKFRSARETLIAAVATPRSRRGSMRDRRQADAALYYSFTLAKAALVDDQACIIPIHELLSVDTTGNTKVVLDPVDDTSFVLVAVQDIKQGATLTRDVSIDAPALPGDNTAGGSLLALNLRFGLRRPSSSS